MKAVHLQGAETVHRRYPQVYNGCSQELVENIQENIQNEMPYLDIYMVIAIFYIAGNWKDCKHIKWESANSWVKRDLHKIARTADQWMTKEEHGRLLEVLSHLDKGTGRSGL